MGSQVITTTGNTNWNWPAGVTSVTVELLGGGGGGGTATGNPSRGGGGKGGGYSKKVITKGVESLLAISVGTGGAASGNGAVSTTTQNGSVVQTATGGVGAVSTSTATGAGATTNVGTASGDTTFAGGNGAAGTSGGVSGAGGGAAGPASAGGNATAGLAGSRGTGTWLDGSTTRNTAGAAGVSASAAGTAGAVYGSGGSGGAAGNNTDRAGGVGAQGAALLTWTDPTATLNQTSFRFYEDGAESSSTAIDAQDTNINRVVVADTNLQIRVRVQEIAGINGLTTDDYQLNCALSGGGYINISLGAVVPFDSASLTDGGATTNRLGSGSGSFVAGKISEDAVTDNFQITASNYTELLYSLTISSADVVHGDTLDFRVYLNNSPLDSYTVTPRITVQKNTVTTKTQSGKTAIQKATTQTQSGTARIRLTVARTQNGIARLNLGATKTQTGVSRITVTVPRTQTGKSAVQKATTRTQTGISRIRVTVARTQTGVSRVVQVVPRTQTGTARIRVTVLKTQTGLSRLQKVVPVTQTGVTRITASTSRTQTGKANIAGSSVTLSTDTFTITFDVLDPSLDQTAFRFYEDGAEDTSIAIAAQSTNIVRGMPYPPLIDQLVSYWPLNEASGDAVDIHGANTLTDTNTVTSTTGLVGNAREFTSANAEKLTRTDNATLSVGDDFTWAGWMYLKSVSTTQTLVAKYNGSPNLEYIFYFSTGSGFRFVASSDGAVTGLTQVNQTIAYNTPNAWVFVVAWHNATANTLNMQINNGTVDSVSHSGGVYNGTSSLEVGYNTAVVEGGNCLIDELGLWKRILTPAELTWLYNGGAGRSYTEIITYFG